MPEKFVCGKCGKVAKTKQALERHAAYHEDDRPFSCEVCLQRFKNSDDRGKHYRRLKKDGKFSIACTVCHKHFKTREILQKHVEMLGCNVSIAENVSTQEPMPSASVDNEQAVETVKEEFLPGEGINCTCKICETEFSSTKSLKKHYVEVHNDSKRQVCIQCGQTLSSKDSLARHFSIFHQTSFPFACELCDQKFKIKESLCRHMKFVHQDGGYQCSECNRVFTQPVNLRKHLAVHSAQKEYACKFCGREFRWKQAVQKHELLHINQNSRVTSAESGGEDGHLIDTSHFGDKKFEKNRIFGEKVNDNEDISIKDLRMRFKDVQQSETTSTIMETMSSCSRDGHYDNRGNNSYLDMSKDCHKNQNCSDAELNDEYTFQEKDKESSNLSRDRTPFFKRTFDGSERKEYKKIKSSSDLSMCNEKYSSITGDSKSICNANINNPRYPRNTESTCDDNSEFELLNEDDPDSEDNDDSDNTMVKGKRHLSDNSNKNENEKMQVDENVETDVEIQKLKFLAFTSFPTKKTADAPKLVFKPSSIQNIMADDKQSEKNPEIEKKEVPATQSQRKTFRFPVTSGSLYTKLHNPFIIQNSNENLGTNNSASVDEASSRNVSNIENSKSSSQNGNEASNIVVAPPEHKVPSGKFSLVKHMLSLQNEENFDKTIFENPLYSTHADVKDFELMVERHKVVDKMGTDIVQYDLSAKQNIPFHWLGMSVSKKKMAERKNNGIEHLNTVRESKTKNGEARKMEVTRSEDMHSSHTKPSKETSDEAVDFENANKNNDFESTRYQASCSSTRGKSPVQVQEETQQPHRPQRGFQAMKSLVAERRKSDDLNRTSKSVFSNPFDFQTQPYLPAADCQKQPSELLNYSQSVQSRSSVLQKNETNWNAEATNECRSTETETGNFENPFHRRRQLSLDSSPKNLSVQDKGFSFPRKYTEAPHTASTNSQLGRSFSFTSKSDPNLVHPKHWTTGSERFNTEFMHQDHAFHTRSVTYPQLSNIPGGKNASCMETVSESNERSLVLSSSDSDLGQAGLNKHNPTALKPSAHSINRRSSYTHICSVDTTLNSRQSNNLVRSQSTGHHMYKMSMEREQLGRADFAKSVASSSHFSEKLAEDDFEEASKFDAYTLIDSPHSNNNSHTSRASKSSCSGLTRETDQRNTKALNELRQFRTAETSIKNRYDSDSKHCALENRGDHCGESGICKIEYGSNVQHSVRSPWQQEQKKSDENHLVEMFRLVQEEKGKDYDNIESLLSEYS